MFAHVSPILAFEGAYGAVRCAVRSLVGVAFVASSRGTAISSPCAYAQRLTGPVTAPLGEPVCRGCGTGRRGGGEASAVV